MIYKKGFGQIIAFLAAIGFLVFIFVDIPSFFEEIDTPCLPVKSKLDICISNSSGIVLYGKLDKHLDIKLNLHDEKIDCSIGKDYLNIRTACKDEFGYIYDKKEFKFEIYEDQNLIKTITQAQLQSVLTRALAKPGKLTKHFIKDAEGLFAIRGLIFIAENWNSNTSK